MEEGLEAQSPALVEAHPLDGGVLPIDKDVFFPQLKRRARFLGKISDQAAIRSITARRRGRDMIMGLLSRTMRGAPPDSATFRAHAGKVA